MNILVIATHHGAFLTLQQLMRWKVPNVTVVIPQSQIDKYKSFEGDVFKQYEQNMEKFAGSTYPLFASADWNPADKLRSAHSFINEIGGTGLWLVLEAGSLLGVKWKHEPKSTTFGVVKARVHPKFKKLYTMLGLEETSEVISASSFYVNMDDSSGKVTFLDSDLFMRPDVLYAKSFGMLYCIRYQQMITDAVTINFWMEVIRGKQEKGEWVAYPYHTYLAYAEWVEPYLPEQTYKNIVANGLQTEWLSELVALDL